MSKIENVSNIADFSTIWKTSSDNYFSNVEKASLQYNSAISSLISDYSKTLNNSSKSCIGVFRDYVQKSGRKAAIPISFAKTIQDFDRNLTKSFEANKIISVSTLEISRNNLKAVNEISSSIVNSSKNLIDALISISPRN